MRGFELIQTLTDHFRENGKAGSTIVVDTGGAFTMTVDRVEQRGNLTVIKVKRLIH